MRLGIVEKGNYKTVEYDDLTGYRMEVNGLLYDFGTMIAETRRRVEELWQQPCPDDLIYKRLHFSEERFFNRMLKNEQYGVFHRYTGANVCLGLVSQDETCNLIIHEIAHEIHYRQGGYNGADEVTQELVAIMAEQEYAVRDFEYDPHYTSQQLLHLLMELPGFGYLPFLERWNSVSRVGTTSQISFLINKYLDEMDGDVLRGWLDRRCATADHARLIANALAATSECYALYNRRLLFHRLLTIEGWDRLTGGQVDSIVRALRTLKELDRRNPQAMLGELVEQAFSSI